MVHSINAKLSSFIGYKGPIHIQWVSYYEATDRDPTGSTIEFLRPDHQLLRRVSDAEEILANAIGTDNEDIEYSNFVSHLRNFVSHQYLSSADEARSGNALWVKAGIKMATELVHAKTALEFNDWPRKKLEKDRWRAWLFNLAKDSIDDVLEPIFDALYYNRIKDSTIKINLNGAFKRTLEVNIDMPVETAIEKIYPYLEKYPSDDEILETYNSLLSSNHSQEKYLADYINEHVSLSNMSSTKALKNSLAKGRKSLYS